MRCEACGKPVTFEGYWSASVKAANGMGQAFKLCKECAMAVSFTMQAAVKTIREGGDE